MNEVFDKTTHKIIQEQRGWRKLMTRKFDSVNDDVHAMKADFDSQAKSSREQMNELRLMQLQIQQDMQAM